MNKDYQLWQLQKMLEDPEQKSGLYLIDTDLNDEDIETLIKKTGLYRYVKELLIPTYPNNAFEMSVVGLCHEYNDNSIKNLRAQLLLVDEQKICTN